MFPLMRRRLRRAARLPVSIATYWLGTSNIGSRTLVGCDAPTGPAVDVPIDIPTPTRPELSTLAVLNTCLLAYSADGQAAVDLVGALLGLLLAHASLVEVEPKLAERRDSRCDPRILDETFRAVE